VYAEFGGINSVQAGTGKMENELDLKQVALIGSG
jgi:hypothetical protein